MAVFSLDDKIPQVPETAWVAENATVLGDVQLGEHASVWYGAVVRGDNASIRIGAYTNIQENSVLHVDPGTPLDIADGVTVGHLAMLHGCSVGEGSLIGIGAVVLNGARIGRHCIVGAGALVTEGKSFPDGSLIVGSPAQAVRSLSEEQLQTLKAVPGRYAERADFHRTRLKRMA
jgi:carbonic anhydrase/acetyltransferase-like protein (isoleucine patch superfamily)